MIERKAGTLIADFMAISFPAGYNPDGPVKKAAPRKTKVGLAVLLFLYSLIHSLYRLKMMTASPAPSANLLWSWMKHSSRSFTSRDRFACDASYSGTHLTPAILRCTR